MFLNQIDSSYSFQNKLILMRVDFNVPIDNGKITDDFRIRAALPTIRYILNKEGKLVLISHLGRPKGQVNSKYSLFPIVQRLQELIPEYDVFFAKDCIGEESKRHINALKASQVCVLENVRFHPEETKNEKYFSKELAHGANIFINNAFGSCHRAHSSVVGITSYVKTCLAGFLVEKELFQLQKLIETKNKPFVSILGGGKVSDKIDLVYRLLTYSDIVLIGGGMAYTFLAALGYQIGKSLCEHDKLDIAKRIISKAKEMNKHLILPKDVVVSQQISNNTPILTCPYNQIPSDKMGLDIGIQTQTLFNKYIEQAKTIFWNGPLGVFECKPFSQGTNLVIKSIAKATEKGAFSLIGGGDSASAIQKMGYENLFSHISTGGGASILFLSGANLPGVDVLKKS